MAKSSFLLLLLIQFSAHSQILLEGRLRSKETVPIGVTVMNLVTEEVTTTDADGKFKIRVKVDDLLIFSSVNFEYRRKLVDEDIIESGKLDLELIPKVEKLEEVVVYPDISPESLGIPAGKKKYTPAERRYKAGGEIDPTFFLFPVPVIVMPLDPIINAITGRRAILKKELEVERKELGIKKTKNLFSAEYIGKRFAVEAERVEGFYYYLIDIPDFLEALDSNNRDAMLFVMARESVTYNNQKTE